MKDKKDTWTVTVEMTVFAGDMEENEVIETAESGLANLTDGSDFMGVNVIDAKRDE